MMREIRRDTNIQMYDEPLLSSARPPWENAFKKQFGLLTKLAKELDPEITLPATKSTTNGSHNGPLLSPSMSRSITQSTISASTLQMTKRRPGTAPSARSLKTKQSSAGSTNMTGGDVDPQVSLGGSLPFHQHLFRSLLDPPEVKRTPKGRFNGGGSSSNINSDNSTTNARNHAALVGHQKGSGDGRRDESGWTRSGTPHAISSLSTPQYPLSTYGGESLRTTSLRSLEPGCAPSPQKPEPFEERLSERKHRYFDRDINGVHQAGLLVFHILLLCGSLSIFFCNVYL